MNTTLRFATAIAAIAFSASAFAADPVMPAPYIPAPVAAPAPAAPVITSTPVASHDWSGFYAGVLAGHAWGNSEINNTGRFQTDGWIAGVTAGYNFLNDNFVYGVEADFAWSDLTGSTAVRNQTIDWTSTLRARVGYDFDGVLPFATAGFALAGIRAADTTAPAFTTDEVQLGLTVGAGVEVSLSDAISIKTEYAYTNFGGQWDFGRNNGQDLKFDSHAIKAGLNFSF